MGRGHSPPSPDYSAESAEGGRDPPEDLAALDDAVERALDGKDLDFAFRIITASGNVRHPHEVAHVLEEASGHPVFIGAFHDVTETKAAEEPGLAGSQHAPDVVLRREGPFDFCNPSIS